MRKAIEDLGLFLPTLAAEVDALEMTGSAHDRMRALKAVEILSILVGKVKTQVQQFPVQKER